MRNAHTLRGLMVLAALVSGLVACSPQPARATFKSIDITGADYAQSLALPDAAGTPRQLSEFKGKVVVVFFGFTQCPDACPTALAELAELKKRLGADGARVQPIFVTVDPERDTPQMLSAYVAGFGPDFVALRGTLDQTKAVAKDFKVFFAKAPGKTPGSYTIDHTTGMFIFDPQGRIRLVARHASGVDTLMADVKQLLAGF